MIRYHIATEDIFEVLCEIRKSGKLNARDVLKIVLWCFWDDKIRSYVEGEVLRVSGFFGMRRKTFKGNKVCSIAEVLCYLLLILESGRFVWS